MGAYESKLKEQFLWSLCANKEGRVHEMLEKHPQLASCTLVENTTNPMCRSGFLGLMNMASLLLKKGADVNQRSSDGRTPLMWAAFRNNVKMCEFLMMHGADTGLEDLAGWNALDIAIIKMNYETALVLKRKGLVARNIEQYEGHLWQKYDVGMFIEWLNEEREDVEYARLFDLIKRQQEEWLSKDLVIDTRETWKSFISRQLNFEDPPLVPREELPEELQPHRSFYGKMACFVNGIDPNPAESRIGRRTVIANPIDRSAPTLCQVAPLRHVQSEILAERQQFGAQVVTDFNNLNSEKTINALGGGDNNTDDAHADKTHNILIDDDDNLFGNAPPGGSLKEGNNPDAILRKSQLSPKKSERFSIPAIGSQRKDYQEVDQNV